MNNKKYYKCPKCGTDLRDTGVIVNEYGSSIHELFFNKDGSYKCDEIIDGEVDLCEVYCSVCKCGLSLDFYSLFVNGLPKVIKQD